MGKRSMPNAHPRYSLSSNSLRNNLQAKSRRRREELAALAAASQASYPARNDVVPKLELVERALGELVLPSRKLRKIEAAHLREVATSINSLGFWRPGSD
jgi:hypothetical protein